MNLNEIRQIQQYLRTLFGTDKLSLRTGQGKDAPTEVNMDGEFIGVIYRNFDEGEISYDFNMSILPEDLPKIPSES